MPFLLHQGDITQMIVDGIVNAANRGLKQGGGVCRAIFRGAGVEAMQQACDKVAPIETGEVAITPAFKLPCKYVIHAVGPVWEGGQSHEAKLLASCYRKALHLAYKKGMRSLAFPLISAGIYGYPKELAYTVAVSAIRSFLMIHDLTVYLVLFEEKFFKDGVFRKNTIDEYVKRNLKDSESTQAILAPMSVMRSCLEESCEGIVTEVDQSFSHMLMNLIRDKGLSEVEVYKGANIDRKHFSKIRSNDDYQPTKRTVVAFALSLKLSIKETRTLLEAAGYSLSHSYVFDIIIEYFIKNRQYDIYAINEALFTYEQPLLGA